jgi:ADP-ribose pyrophosphatase YjhB (NUDIX family)
MNINEVALGYGVSINLEALGLITLKQTTKKRSFVCVFMYDTESKCLFLKRSDQERLFPNTWSLCSGGVENNEKLHSAIKREVEEETSLDLNISRFSFLQKIEEPDFINYYFSINITEDEKSRILLNPENDNFVFVHLFDIDKYETIPLLVKHIKKIYYPQLTPEFDLYINKPIKKGLDNTDSLDFNLRRILYVLLDFDNQVKLSKFHIENSILQIEYNFLNSQLTDFQQHEIQHTIYSRLLVLGNGSFGFLITANTVFETANKLELSIQNIENTKQKKPKIDYTLHKYLMK